MHTTTITQTQDFLIADLSGSDYDKLVIFKHWEAHIGGVEHHMPDGFTGRILIDSMTRMGAKNNERFLAGRVINGKYEAGSLAYVMLKREDHLRVFSNRTLVQHCPESLLASVLTNAQQKMLLKGISI
ncbi:hypothetical protein [Paenibacillus sp. Y412MC10]|uniref:hypothetical protein n=1 Tax=Geobacillus sp. (strain Y412MC10) TaxID=481743 RepID=UPI0011A22FA7|nr:hypothetical protein [Paenibacillus sp. Y412MC10]